jgi:hypothetical protein
MENPKTITQNVMPEEVVLFPLLERVGRVARVLADYALHRHCELFSDEKPNTGGGPALDRALDEPQQKLW